MRLKDWLARNEKFFSLSDIRFMTKNILGEDLTKLLVSETDLCDDELDKLDRLSHYYRGGTPLAYLLGKEEFFGMDFFVEEGVFIPRPETEILVEEVLRIIQQERIQYILDLCCGTGCVAVAIDKMCGLEDVVIVASDISYHALKVSYRNIHRHNCRVKLVNADILDGFRYGTWDIIVSNPPYVEREYLDNTPPLLHEPRIALYGGEDGLRVIRRIVSCAPHYLKKGGYLVMEVGYSQKNAVDEIIASSGSLVIERWVRDYSNKWRVVVAKNG